MSNSNQLRVAIVGSGPSGFYAAETLLRAGVCLSVDVFEKLPVPYGLVRSGVAPDHQKLKQVEHVFEAIAAAPEFNFIGNVDVGKDLGVDELRENYHAVIIACGAQTGRPLGIPGEDLGGCYTATEFVSWYNGHVDYQYLDIDLSCETAVVVGQGNVAADVARILAKEPPDLQASDITNSALKVLASSKVRNIVILGRRGMAQAKFTGKELKELGSLDACSVRVSDADLMLNNASQYELKQRDNRQANKNYELLKSFSSDVFIEKAKVCHFQFLSSPVRIEGDERVNRVIVERNFLVGEPFNQVAMGTGELSSVSAGLVISCVGYRGLPIAGVPFDEKRGVVSNVGGRVSDEAGHIPGLYVTDWIKRGPTGIIGTNRADSEETVSALLEDIKGKNVKAKRGLDAIYPMLDARQIRHVSFDGWQMINSSEKEKGRNAGKPREKILCVEEMLGLVG